MQTTTHSPPAAPAPLDRMLSAREVQTITTLNRMTINRLRASGNFPEPLQLTKSRIAWRASDVMTWLADRKPAPRPQAA